MSTTLKTIGVFLNGETKDFFTETLATIDGVELTSHLPSETDWHVEDVGTKELPDLFIYEIDGSKEEEIKFLEQLVRENEGKFSVMVTYQDGDISTIRRLMRAGIKDVLPQPVVRAELIQSVTVALSEKRKKIKSALGGKGGVTAFVNAKGGTGATTIAVNVAHTLATKHKAEVALIDLDIQFGSVALQLDLHPTSNVLEALLQPERIDPVFIKALMTRHASGLDVLASPADLSPIVKIDPNAVRRVLSATAEIYDYVVVDMPRVYTDWIVAALKFADPIMLVVENNLPTVRDAKLLLDRMSHDGISFANIELINNRAMSKQASVTIEGLKETLGKEKIRRVRNDYKTANHAQDTGKPVHEVAASSDLSKDIAAIAAYIVEQHQGGKTKAKKGIFSRLFSH
ncbi:MAG: AAA family ATPase [Gammaproteobacteria bacterium]|nr:AAA family ATPase [Gammaproteobacteria bacterium]